MKILPVSFSSIQNNQHTLNTNKVNTFIKADSCSFNGGFKSFSHEKEFEKPFEELLTTILNSNKIEKNKHFYAFYEVYKRKGLKGTLLSLWQANPTENIAKTVSKHVQESVVLAKSGNEPVLELFNWGKHGFFNSIFDNKTAPNDVKLLFTKNKSSFEFYLDK